MTITRKIKIGEFLFIIFPVLFSTLHTFHRVSTTSEWGDLHVRKWEIAGCSLGKAKQFFDHFFYTISLLIKSNYSKVGPT